MKVGGKLIREYKIALSKVVPTDALSSPLIGDFADLELHLLDLRSLMDKLKSCGSAEELDSVLFEVDIFLSSDLNLVISDVLSGVRALRERLHSE